MVLVHWWKTICIVSFFSTVRTFSNSLVCLPFQQTKQQLDMCPSWHIASTDKSILICFYLMFFCVLLGYQFTWFNFELDPFLIDHNRSFLFAFLFLWLQMRIKLNWKQFACFLQSTSLCNPPNFNSFVQLSGEKSNQFLIQVWFHCIFIYSVFSYSYYSCI